MLWEKSRKPHWREHSYVTLIGRRSRRCRLSLSLVVCGTLMYHVCRPAGGQFDLLSWKNPYLCIPRRSWGSSGRVCRCSVSRNTLPLCFMIVLRHWCHPTLYSCEKCLLCNVTKVPVRLRSWWEPLFIEHWLCTFWLQMEAAVTS